MWHQQMQGGRRLSRASWGQTNTFDLNTSEGLVMLTSIPEVEPREMWWCCQNPPLPPLSLADLIPGPKHPEAWQYPSMPMHLLALMRAFMYKEHFQAGLLLFAIKEHSREGKQNNKISMRKSKVWVSRCEGFPSLTLSKSCLPQWTDGRTCI